MKYVVRIEFLAIAILLFSLAEFISVAMYTPVGLVKGYMAEKQTADECIRSLENRNEALIKETERLRARVRELDDSQKDVAQREQDLVRQQQTMELGVDDATKGMHVILLI